MYTKEQNEEIEKYAECLIVISEKIHISMLSGQINWATSI